MNNELTDEELAMLIGGNDTDEELAAACPYSGESCDWARRGITDYCAGCDAIND